jgi:ATP-dependent DNA ligase
MEFQVAEGNPKNIFSEKFFTRRIIVALPAYIRAPHPKTGILPNPSSIKRILDQGWVGQLKIHGHRCQLHIPATGKKIIAYNRQGKPHALPLAPKIVDEILRLFQSRTGWNVIDAEWLKPEEKIFVFDFLKQDDVLLNKLPYPERWEKLPRAYLSPHLQTLPLVRDLKGCLAALESTDDKIEGLVFKSLTRPGFADTSIIRCRKRL